MMELMKWKSPERPIDDGSTTYNAKKKIDMEKVVNLLQQVQLPDAEGILKRYPHEVSGTKTKAYDCDGPPT